MSDDIRAARVMPVQKPGRSIQDYGTPLEFIAAVEKRWGKLDIDLASTALNAKAPKFITPEEDSLAKSTKWELSEANGWLNPPFGVIEPWVRKVAEHAAKVQLILMLIPASVGSNWWAEHVHDKCIVHLLRPRLSFDGKNPYPKDCALLEYSETISALPGHGAFAERYRAPSYECWKWK